MICMKDSIFMYSLLELIVFTNEFSIITYRLKNDPRLNPNLSLTNPRIKKNVELEHPDLEPTGLEPLHLAMKFSFIGTGEATSNRQDENTFQQLIGTKEQKQHVG